MENKDIWTAPSPSNPAPLTIKPGKALGLLACFLIICYIITGVLSLAIGRLASGNQAAAIRIAAVLQDVILFIVPAVATAVICTRRPAQLLFLARAPRLLSCGLAVAALVAAIPALDGIIYWNYHWDWLPESIARISHTLEDAAAATMNVLLADGSVMALTVNILIIGIAAGVSEELLFRGAILGILLRSRLNTHVAVWLVAVIFSAVHMQLYGFVPRMLLGAYFGYLMVWSRSVWLPVLAHAFNNTVFVCSAWWQSSHGQPIDQEPSLWSWGWVGGSVVLTAAVLYVLCRSSDSQPSDPQSGSRFISSM